MKLRLGMMRCGMCWCICIVEMLWRCPKEVATCVDDECCKHLACRPAVDFMVEVLYVAFRFGVVELVWLYQRGLMDLYYELLKEFDRVVNQCDQGVNMPSNVNISNNTGGSKEQGSMMQSISGGLGEAGSNVASPVVMNETLEVMKVALAEQNGIERSSFPSEEVNTPWPVNWNLDKGVPQFLSKVYLIVDDPMTDHVVHWGLEGTSFIVQDAVTFCNSILPKYFKHGNFSSFIRQLNTYGFRKIDCDKWEFATLEFQRGKIHQLKNINRRSSVSKQMKLRSGKQDDTFQKHLKNLSAQISNLSQQLEVSSSIVSAYEKKMQDIELKYKQMTSVLSKTIQNPGFMAELLKRKAFVQSKHGSDCVTEASSEQKMAEAHGITKLSFETAHLLCDCKSTAQSQTEMQLSPYISAPNIGESSCSPNNSQEVVMDDSLQSLHNELMKEVEPCEGLGSDKCISYFHELLSLIPVDESDSGCVAYANQHIDKKPKVISGEVQGS